MKAVVRMWVAVVVMVVTCCVGASYVLAQDKVETKLQALTTEQKQAIQILAQRIELAQLRAQAAQAEFDKARGEITALVQSLQKDGYDLDISTGVYTKKPSETKK